MAVYTALDMQAAGAVARAHGLPLPTRVEPVAEGSVNSNYWLVSGRGRWFLRIYEEQGIDGVAYEWALLAHLASAGIPGPTRIAGPAPGSVSVAGKPVALFAKIGGRTSCQAAVSALRVRRVGRMLAQIHQATDSFAARRAGFLKADGGLDGL